MQYHGCCMNEPEGEFFFFFFLTNSSPSRNKSRVFPSMFRNRAGWFSSQTGTKIITNPITLHAGYTQRRLVKPRAAKMTYSVLKLLWIQRCIATHFWHQREWELKMSPGFHCSVSDTAWPLFLPPPESFRVCLLVCLQYYTQTWMLHGPQPRTDPNDLNKKGRLKVAGIYVQVKVRI